MTFNRALVLGILSLGLLVNTGCGSSSPASNSSTTVVGASGVGTNCTTNTDGDPEVCIPNLGDYGNYVEYFGQVNVTNAGLLSYVFSQIPGYPSVSTSLIQSYTYLDIFLNATASPAVTMTILVGPEPAYEYQIQGPPSFTETSSSNPNAGTFSLNAPGLSIVDPIAINSLTQPWDGSLENMTALTITIPPKNSTIPATFGTVGLIRIQ